jgi:hypothetical protein
MIYALRVLFILMFFYMTFVVVSTSLESNLFEEWSNLAAIPWLVATIKDFYANTIIISLWMFYKEKTWGARLLWFLLFVGLGSIATSAYVLMILFRVSVNDPVENVLLRSR